MPSSPLAHTAIVFGAEEHHLWAIFCSIESILTHHAHTKLTFYILHTTIPETLQNIALQLFPRPRCTLTFINLHQKAMALRSHTHQRWQITCFYKCYLPILFHDVPTILWLDHDLLVTGDITALHHHFPAHAGVGAVVDSVAHILRYNNVSTHQLLGDSPAYDLADMPLHTYLRRYLGLTQPESYFNSGMLLLHPPAIPSSHINLCFTLAKQPHLYPGTDILNRVFHQTVHLLPERWNFVTGKLTEALCLHLPEHKQQQREGERHQRRILHFPEGTKPWEDSSSPCAIHYRHLSATLEARLSRTAPSLIRSLCS